MNDLGKGPASGPHLTLMSKILNLMAKDLFNWPTVMVNSFGLVFPKYLSVSNNI